MFEVVGNCIVMGNVIDELKEKSIYIIKSNDENGVVYFINWFFDNE